MTKLQLKKLIKEVLAEEDNTEKYVVQYDDESLIYGSGNTDVFILTRRQLKKDLDKGLRPLAIYKLGEKMPVEMFLKK